MSRTDKDTPWWVTAEEWEPVHFRCPHATRRGWQTVNRDRTCDLPPDPVVSRYRGSRRRYGKNCGWEPVWGRVGHGMPGPPHWYIDHVWNAPTRRAVRDDCREAAKEYRGTGEIEVVPPTVQHRHCAAWLYW